MTAFTMSVTQLCENDVLYGGWSDSSNRGVTHVTGGSRFALMSVTRSSTERTCAFQYASSWKTSWMPL